MKIVLDLRSICNLQSGDGQFAGHMLVRLGAADKRNAYTVLVRPGNKWLFKLPGENFEYKIEDIKPYSLKERVYLPKVINSLSPAIYHTFTFSYPRGIRCKKIISVYDITHLVHQGLFSLKLRLYYRFVVEPCIKEADAVLTISDKSRADIISRFKIGPDKVRRVYCGVNPVYREIDKGVAKKYVRDRFSVSGDFILYVGQIKRHKNIDAIARALPYIKDTRISLVICGRRSSEERWLPRLVNGLGLSSRVVIIDSPSDEDLLNFYNAARVFVYPSLYEGFGLPPLEAMACGTPAVASNAGSIPEVLGDAALLVPPDDKAALARAIIEVLSNDKLSGELLAKGLKRSALFSWDTAAAELLRLYEDARGG